MIRLLREIPPLAVPKYQSYAGSLLRMKRCVRMGIFFFTGKRKTSSENITIFIHGITGKREIVLAYRYDPERATRLLRKASPIVSGRSRCITKRIVHFT